MPSAIPKKRKVFESAVTSESLSLGDLNDFLGIKIRRIQRSINRHLSDALQGMDVAVGEFGTLGLIAANPGLAQIDIAREYDIDKATMVGLLDKLEGAGYVRRRRHPTDRRRNALTLTEKGDRRFAELKAAFAAQEASFTQSLTKAEKKRLMDLLDRIPLQ